MTDLQTQITMDIGRKCAEDVGGAMRRNMALVDGFNAKMIVAAHAAAAAVGGASGTLAVLLGGTPDLNPEFVDQAWADFIRPMILGQFVSEGRDHG